MTETADDRRWRAVIERKRDRNEPFVYAVATTGIFCRPGCPSRRPRREHVSFFPTAAEAERAGFRPCRRCRPADPPARPDDRISAIRAYIESHLDDKVTLARLGHRAGLSPFHLQRVFKAATGLTPKQYAEACRLSKLKTSLKEGQAVTDAVYDAGYPSSSRVYEKAVARLGMTPGTYRRGGAGTVIRYSTGPTSVGCVLVAATERGICGIRLGASEGALVQALRAEYPAAELVEGGAALAAWRDQIANSVAGTAGPPRLPTDIDASAFQQRVWDYLRTIPRGRTRSYGDVARAIGAPGASRAVARACRTNPLALVVPCHRVVQADGKAGGYRWGAERKRALLALEAGATSTLRGPSAPDRSRPGSSRSCRGGRRG
jgi:AraC family transcriptional regulator of adaptative response/methylated-DNA-[protein]-cysteine methyltransferase